MTDIIDKMAQQYEEIKNIARLRALYDVQLMTPEQLKAEIDKLRSLLGLK